jgi:hypothetical protein
MTNIDLLDLIEEIQDAINYFDDALERYEDRADLSALMMGKRNGMKMVLEIIEKRNVA